MPDRLPKNSCDTHLHVFGNAKTYPVGNPNALYQPPVDPATGKTLDATKPVGQWNHIRLVISPDKCIHEINGVKYFEYVLGSDDFNARVAKSKFGRMPLFAKSNTGYIALQGDHGSVSFRNIKIRALPAGK